MTAGDEPMAIVRWEFFSKAFPGRMIRGSHEMKSVSEARKLADRMNEEYGDGTHHVEVLNQTYSERFSDNEHPF